MEKSLLLVPSPTEPSMSGAPDLDPAWGYGLLWRCSTAAATKQAAVHARKCHRLLAYMGGYP